jgi:pimeloyl-ACP methyl ester carboxylesterase
LKHTKQSEFAADILSKPGDVRIWLCHLPDPSIMFVNHVPPVPGPAVRDHIMVDSLRIGVEDGGHGVPLILLHGSAASASQWRALRAALEPRFRMLAPDLIGYGRSSAWHGRRVPRLDDEIEIVTELLDRCQRPARLIGHSYGGAVALQAALNMPDRVVDLVLIEPVAFSLLGTGGSADARLLADIRQLAGEIAGELAAARPEAAMARFVEYWNGTGAWAKLTPERRAELAGRGARVVDNFRALFRHRPVLAHLHQLRVPTLLLQGGCSPEPTRRIVERLAGTLPLALTRTIPGAGHMAPLTHPEEVNAVIEAFLRPARRSRSAEWVPALELAA